MSIHVTTLLTWLIACICGSKGVFGVVRFFTHIIMANIISFDESCSHRKTVFDYVAIVIAPCRWFSGGWGNKSRTIKVIEVIPNIVVQKLIVCRTRDGDGAWGSGGGCKISRTIKFDLLIGSKGNYATFCCRIEKIRCSRTDQQRLRFACDLIKFNNFAIIFLKMNSEAYPSRH